MQIKLTEISKKTEVCFFCLLNFLENEENNEEIESYCAWGKTFKAHWIEVPLCDRHYGCTNYYEKPIPHIQKDKLVEFNWELYASEVMRKNNDPMFQELLSIQDFCRKNSINY